MSTSELQSEWNYRTQASRQVIVKAKNSEVRKISVIDLQKKRPFLLTAPPDFEMETLELEKGYFVTFKIYTLKNVQDVTPDFIEFFTAVDIDQNVEDFIKAYWLYPNCIKFELTDTEPL
jgi:hypothetical protein